MISAVVLAAGLSSRMGKPKMLLPWGKTTVIEKVIATLADAGIDSIYVVVGGNSPDVKKVLSGYALNFVLNPDYASGEMLSSVQVGLLRLPKETETALIVLGDQPQIEATIVREITENYLQSKEKIVVPSYQRHRGHPWLVDGSLWPEIINLQPPSTLRDFLINNERKISYVEVDTDSILHDLDTPHDYQQRKP